MPWRKVKLLAGVYLNALGILALVGGILPAMVSSEHTLPVLAGAVFGPVLVLLCSFNIYRCSMKMRELKVE